MSLIFCRSKNSALPPSFFFCFGVESKAKTCFSSILLGNFLLYTYTLLYTQNVTKLFTGLLQPTFREIGICLELGPDFVGPRSFLIPSLFPLPSSFPWPSFFLLLLFSFGFGFFFSESVAQRHDGSCDCQLLVFWVPSKTSGLLF